jgi:hypothetical protein
MVCMPASTGPPLPELEGSQETERNDVMLKLLSYRHSHSHHYNLAYRFLQELDDRLESRRMLITWIQMPADSTVI